MTYSIKNYVETFYIFVITQRSFNQKNEFTLKNTADQVACRSENGKKPPKFRGA